MLLALDTTEKELVETASVEMRLAADAETIAAAVSYTHLDVYKRQIHEHVARNIFLKEEGLL